MAYAWAFLATGHPAQAEACLQSVEQAIGRPMTALVSESAVATSLPDSVAAALAEVTIVRINLAMGELDLAGASRLALVVLPYLEIDPEYFLFNRPDDLRTVVMFTSGLVQLHTGELDAAAAQLRRTRGAWPRARATCTWRRWPLATWPAYSSHAANSARPQRRASVARTKWPRWHGAARQ